MVNPGVRVLMLPASIFVIIIPSRDSHASFPSPKSSQFASDPFITPFNSHICPFFILIINLDYHRDSSIYHREISAVGSRNRGA